MPDYLDFLPLVRRSVDEIRASMDADANAGLDPTDDRWVDTTAGGFFFDLTQGSALEFARLWDFLGAEVPAGALLPFAFGEYLDDWGDALDVARKDAVAATGEVTFTGDAGSLVATGTEVAVPQTDPDADPIAFHTTTSGVLSGGGTLTLPVVASDTGAAANVAVGAISLLQTPATGIGAVTNAAPTTGGADVETDEAYLDRLLLEFRGAQGSGTVADYQRWALAYPGVGFASVQPVWNGPGTVRVVVTDASNHPVSTDIVTGLQTELDPVAGEGRGMSPIGHTVTVATVGTHNVAVAATVVHSAGYSLDGAAGTVATRPAIEAALHGYVDRLSPGDDVVLRRVQALFFGVEGVYDVTPVTLNGAAADVAVAALEVAVLTTVTLA